MAPSQQAVQRRDDGLVGLPDPGAATTLDELVDTLRSLRSWAGSPSYERITGRVNATWAAAGRPASDLAGKTTVVDCFRSGRRRLNPDLFVAIVQALQPDVGYVSQWRQALRAIDGGTHSASQVRVQDGLPPDLPEFTGRTAELDRIVTAMRPDTANGGAGAVLAVSGMAGIGKTQLIVRAAHLVAREQSFERVLFVDLRGFHPDPAQPPVDPAAVLDGFLRLLGVPGQQIPHSLAARAAVFRQRLAGTRTLIVLDNAADSNQVRPLLPDTSGCPVLVTSRRRLTGLRTATHLAIHPFTSAEALAFLMRTDRVIPVGPDPDAPHRIATRCGHLPLALELIAAHIRGTPGWSLTDHAERLDERHQARRLDSGVQVAFDLSYRHLPADRRRLLRLAALHPGHDFDTFAAAALVGTDLPAAEAALEHLCRDHLLQPIAGGRYTLHDLVGAYATSRAGDEDSPSDRRAALTRLFDYYVATAAAAMDRLHPAEAHLRPPVPSQATPAPELSDPDAARAWLDTERHTLVAVAAYSATRGWPTHTQRVSTTVFRYLLGGHLTDALTVHSHALDAARLTGDLTGQAHALKNVGVARYRLGQHRLAAEHLATAVDLFAATGDVTGRASALRSAGNVEGLLGRHEQAVDHYHQALACYREVGDRSGEGSVLGNLGVAEARQGRHQPAIEYFSQALEICRQTSAHEDEGWVLNNLGECEVRSGRHEAAAEHLHHGLALFRRLGNRTGEAWTLNTIGELHAGLEQPNRAVEYYRQALAVFTETGDKEGEAVALNDLGAAMDAAGRFADAVTHHTAALATATATGDRRQQAGALNGLGRAHQRLGQASLARECYHDALALFSDLDLPDADQVRARLRDLDQAQDATPDGVTRPSPSVVDA